MRRAAGVLGRIQRSLKSWYDFGAGYDPVFTFWCAEPWKALNTALTGHQKFLEQTIGEIDPKDEDRLLGNPIGRDALLSALVAERIAYSPEELIAIAEREFAWCDDQRAQAASAMGLDGDWRAAQNKVRGIQVPPGDQPAMIRELADEATNTSKSATCSPFPSSPKKPGAWAMMSPARQRFSPYFTGGEVISISYPHPGHGPRIQAAIHARQQPPLLPGGGAPRIDPWPPPAGLHGGSLEHPPRHLSHPLPGGGLGPLLGAAPVGPGLCPIPRRRNRHALWRSHRCARILFSLNYHLGNWSAEECVEFLIDRVGHDPGNATAEVRRSIQGGMGPYTKPPTCWGACN